MGNTQSSNGTGDASMASSRFTDPTFGRAEPKVPWAPRPPSLHGKVIGLLDNTKEQTQIILTTIGDALVERYGAARVVYRTKETFSSLPPRRSSTQWRPKCTSRSPRLAGEAHARCAVCTTRSNSRKRASPRR
ncbi:MAG: UGSC family (seleno)protein [Burkholderiales bacterium]